MSPIGWTIMLTIVAIIAIVVGIALGPLAKFAEHTFFSPDDGDE